MSRLGRKVVAMLVAMVMVLSISMVAAAAVSADTGSVVVSTSDTALEGETVTLVKIFDVEINSDTGAVSYVLRSEIEGFFQSSVINNGAFTGLSGTELSTAVVSYMEGLADDEQTLSDLSKALWVWAIQPENSVNLMRYTETFELGVDTCTATFDAVEYGYYLGYSSGNQISLFDVMEASVNVHLKTKNPTVVKTVDEKHVEIGETVNFTLTTYIPDTEGYDDYTLVVHDIMDAGFTYVNPSIVVTMDGTTLIAGVQYTTGTIDENEDGTTSFTVDLSNVVTTANAGKVIEITYSAMLDKDAEIESIANINTAYLEYTDGVGSTLEDIDNASHTETYTFDIDIQKIAIANGETTNLSGANFEIYRADSNGNITGSAIALMDLGDGDYRLATKYDVETTYAMVSGTDGLIHLIGVDEGIYYLVETVAPEGYNVLTDPVQFEVTAIEESGGSINGSTVTYAGTDGSDIVLTGSNPIVIENKSGITLPETGAMGTLLLTILGTVAVIGGTTYIVIRKRRTRAGA